MYRAGLAHSLTHSLVCGGFTVDVSAQSAAAVLQSSDRRHRLQQTPRTELFPVRSFHRVPFQFHSVLGRAVPPRVRRPRAAVAVAAADCRTAGGT